MYMCIYIYVQLVPDALVALQERLARRLEKPCDHGRFVFHCQKTENRC